MTDKTAIKVSSLTKVYKLYDKPVDRLKESLHPLKKQYHKDFYALNNVSFEINKGETIGIIGKNGAGKSTLLKIITGVLTPTTGEVQVNGRVSSLLELGAGFNPEYTGMENIYLQGILMGYSRENMHERVNPILEFADIGDFIYQPVKTYSSGMFARLAFSVAINVDPDILIVDEALSVGDIRFQQKCYRKFKEFQDQGRTILFVTHDTGTIVNYCSHVVWLHKGEKYMEGNPKEVCKKYDAFMAYNQITEVNTTANENKGQDIEQAVEWISSDMFEFFGEGGVKITHIALVNQNNQSQGHYKIGDHMVLKFRVCAMDDVDNLIVGFIIFDHLGNAILGSNTNVHTCINSDDLNVKKGHTYEVNFVFSLPNIRNGEYTISPAIAEGTQSEHIQHHWIHNMLNFHVHSLNKEAEMGWLVLNDDIKVEIIHET